MADVVNITDKTILPEIEKNGAVQIEKNSNIKNLLHDKQRQKKDKIY